MSKNGFTLVEMIVAITILAAAILALSTSSSSLARVALETETRALALQACEDRIAEIRLHPIYPQLDSLYSENGSGVVGLEGFSRNTEITRIIREGEREGKFIDFTRITVTVNGPGLSNAVSRSVSIGHF
jgi:prepilin-type N-terminal cleavage/methylation domain-containing protein